MPLSPDPSRVISAVCRAEGALLCVMEAYEGRMPEPAYHAIWAAAAAVGEARMELDGKPDDAVDDGAGI